MLEQSLRVLDVLLSLFTGIFACFIGLIDLLGLLFFRPESGELAPDVIPTPHSRPVRPLPSHSVGWPKGYAVTATCGTQTCDNTI